MVDAMKKALKVMLILIPVLIVAFFAVKLLQTMHNIEIKEANIDSETGVNIETTIPPETEQATLEEQAEITVESADENDAQAAQEIQLPPKPEIDITSWEFIIANSFNSIREYAPPYASFEGQGIDQRIFEQASAFLNAARNAGFSVWYSTTLRNYDYLQNRYFRYRYYVVEDAVQAANDMLAPGLDEHQTGLAVDFTDRPDCSALYEEFEDPYIKDTELYQWLVEHCAEYGFVLRYPEGKEHIYGVACKHPAHFRYVGTEAAKYMMENNLCLEEFIQLYNPKLVYIPDAD